MTPKDDEISARAATLLSPLNVSGSCTIENLDIIAANCRYAIHDEASSKSEYAGSVHTVLAIVARRHRWAGYR